MAVAVVAMVAAGVSGCGSKSKTSQATTSTIATTTTTLPPDAVSNLIVVGVRPGVLQQPFYPQLTVTKVSCGVFNKTGRFVRIDLPPGGPGTPARSVLTKPTAVIVVPGAAVLIDPSFPNRGLYAEGMKSIVTATQGAFVLTMNSNMATGGDGLAVVSGAVQVNGDYLCPSVDVAYPGT